MAVCCQKQKGVKMADINNEIPLGTWCWCMHCGRCYKKGEYRVVKMRKNSFEYKFAISEGLDPDYHLCPYEDCDGDVVIDCNSWFENLPDRPKIPERNKVYPMC